MKKFFIQVGALLIVTFGALWVSYNSSVLTPILPNSAGTVSQLPKTQVKINDAIIDVEVADTQSKRSQGLSGRENLATNTGMLFIFPQASKYRFWMKEMKFPLDFIFINNGKVVDLYKNVPPPLPSQAETTLPQYEPSSPINMVLEVNVGFIDQYNVKVGDDVFQVKQ